MIRNAVRYPPSAESWRKQLVGVLDNRDREVSAEINNVLHPAVELVQTDLDTAEENITDLITRTERWINVVDDYGADPTGTTDATTAIQNAITNNPGRVIWFPRGEYLTGPIAIKTPGTSLIGEVFGGKVFGGYAAGELGVAWKYNGTAGGIMLRVHSETASVDVSGIHVAGIHFNGNDSAGVGIKTESCVSSRFERFKISGCTSIGLFATGDDNNGTYEQTYGLLKNSYHVTYHDFYIVMTNPSTGVGLKLGAQYGLNEKKEKACYCIFDQFHITFSNGIGIEFANGDDCTFSRGSTSMETGCSGEAVICRANNYGRVYSASFKDCLFSYHQGSITVSSVTANSKNEYRVVTSAAHGRTTGNQVDIMRAQGVSGLNGRHTVTVIDTTTLDLDGTYYIGGTCSYALIETTKSPRFIVEGTETGKTYPAVNIKVEMRGGDYSHLFKIGTGAQVHYEKFSIGNNVAFYHKNFSRLRFDPGTDGPLDDNSNQVADCRVLDWYEESEVPFVPALVDATAEASITDVYNSSGLIGIEATAHGLVTGNAVWISQVVGVPQSRGWWLVTRIDDDNFTLQGSYWCSRFSYTSGGKYVRCSLASSSKMSWTRIGNRVFFQLDLSTGTSGHQFMSGVLYVRGLPPFTAMSSGERAVAAVAWGGVDLPTNATAVTAKVDKNNYNNDGPRIILYTSGNGIALAQLDHASLSTTVGFHISISGNYETYGAIKSEYAINREVEF